MGAKSIMQNKRQHKRYHLDSMEINGTMSLTDKVKILDISLGGVSLKADRRLNIGKEYVIKLQEKGKTIEVKGIVVRSELSGLEQRSPGESVSIYTAGVTFKGIFADKIADFLKPIEQTRQKKAPSVADRRLNVRFNLTAPKEKLFNYPAHFKVITISRSGLLIQTDRAVEVNGTIPMELSLNDQVVTFIGRVASCAITDKTDQSPYAIGVEFTQLTDRDKTLIDTFIDYLAEIDVKNEEQKKAARLS